MRILKKLGTMFDRLNYYLAVWAILLLVFVWVSVCADVFARYVIGRSIIWASEVTGIILVHIAFLGSAWLLNEEGHVSVEFVVEHLSAGGKAAINTVTSILAAIVWLVITWYTGQYVVRAFQAGTLMNTLMEPPKYAVLAVIPFGSFLLFVQFSRRSYKHLCNFRALRNNQKPLTAAELSK